MIEPLLTTITPVWGRDQMFQKWCRHMRAAQHPQVRHLVVLVNEKIPSWWWELGLPSNFVLREVWSNVSNVSIGAHHNFGAEESRSEWIMKLDVDTIPHVNFWQALLPVLEKAAPRQWFNVGMGYMTQRVSESVVSGFTSSHLTGEVVVRMLQSPRDYFANWRGSPAGTNFVARREDYLLQAACDPRFRGYGWEDYQQIYDLERFEIGGDPFCGTSVTYQNVTRLCRDVIGMRKAAELLSKNGCLCLLHHWHPVGSGLYRNRGQMDRNRAVLLEHCSRKG